MTIEQRFRFVVHDGAGQYAPSFDTVVGGADMTAITTPPRAPQANAYAERWVRTLRHELLDRTLIFNERQLRALLSDYIEHYNTHRPHRSLDQHAPNDDPGVVIPIAADRPVERHSTCAGLINEYHAAA